MKQYFCLKLSLKPSHFRVIVNFSNIIHKFPFIVFGDESMMALVGVLYTLKVIISQNQSLIIILAILNDTEIFGLDESLKLKSLKSSYGESVLDLKGLL